MANAGQWQLLTLDLPDAPRILFKCNTSRSGYCVQLTDLSRIWEEDLSHVDILKRAVDSACSVDPSEDDEQYDILLNKIDGALKQELGTSISLEPSDEDDDGLVIAVTSPLPRPLAPFRWRIALRRLEPARLADHLVNPLLAQANRLRGHIEQLLHELQDKDRVISKICDRLETSGNDLTTVFPGVSNVKTSRKKSQRDQLAKHVKGLSDFDADAWRGKHNDEAPPSEMSQQELNDVLKHLPAAVESHSQDRADEDWWKALAHGPIVDARRHQKPQLSNASIPREDSAQDEEFQRQPTPPQFKQASPAPDAASESESDVARAEVGSSAQLDDDESTTEDDDDLDAPMKKSVPTKPSPPKTAAPRKVGIIGGHQRGTSPKAESIARDKSSSPAPTPARAPPAKKLGMMGGKAKAKPPASRSSTTPYAEPTSPPEAQPEPKARAIGIVGGKRKAETSVEPTTELTAAEAMDVDRQQSPTRGRGSTKEPTPPPRETSQERADKKRDQLRRDMEKKATSAPTKKKRKF